MRWRQWQAWVLRLVGTVELMALGAVVMPRHSMQTHYRWLSGAEMPTGPVFESVMRQVSLTYALHGVGMWLIASDVRRYRPMVLLAAVGYLVAGPILVTIDSILEMPSPWIVGNGGSCLLIGIILAALLVGEKLGGAGLPTQQPPENRP